MGVLRNPKHELFCQHIATSPKTGWPQGRCYTEAGFKTADRSADACAARLLTRANIQARIAELVEPTVKKTRATVDTLALQFDAVFDGAMGSAQFGAAGSAAAAKAKLLGFMRERLEISQTGVFDTLKTPADTVDALLVDMDAQELIDVLDKMRGIIEDRMASMARDVSPSSTKPMPSEAEHALSIFRPGKRH